MYIFFVYFSFFIFLFILSSLHHCSIPTPVKNLSMQSLTASIHPPFFLSFLNYSFLCAFIHPSFYSFSYLFIHSLIIYRFINFIIGSVLFILYYFYYFYFFRFFTFIHALIFESILEVIYLGPLKSR